MFFDFIEKVKEDPIIKIIKKEAEGDIYLVGGFIRNFFFQKESFDYDFILYKPYKFCKSFANKKRIKIIKLGKRNETIYRFILKGKTLDFSGIKYKDLETNLKRRDFTINSVAINLKDFSIIDPLFGLKDLEKKLIRICHKDAFLKDPLRILRAYRILSIFPFMKIEEETHKKLIEEKSFLKRVSKERIVFELKMILSQRSASDVIQMLVKDEIIFEIFPALKSIKGLTQGRPHKDDVLNHTLNVLALLDEKMSFLKDNLGFNPVEEELLIVRLASLFHDIGKAETKIINTNGIHFYGHEKVSSTLVEESLKGLKFPNNTIERVSRLCRLHMRPLWLFYEKSHKISKERKLIAEAEEDFVNLLSLSYLDFVSMDRSEKEKEDFLLFLKSILRLYLDVKEEVTHVKKLITGEEAMKILGLKKGNKFLGLALKALKEAQIEGKVKSFDEAYEFLVNYGKRFKESVESE